MSKKVRNFAPVFEREKVMEQAPSKAAPKHFPKRPGGGMVDAVDSKSAVSNGVGVQVPPGVQKRQSHLALSFFFCLLLFFIIIFVFDRSYNRCEYLAPGCIHVAIHFAAWHLYNAFCCAIIHGKKTVRLFGRLSSLSQYAL